MKLALYLHKAFLLEQFGSLCTPFQPKLLCTQLLTTTAQGGNWNDTQHFRDAVVMCLVVLDVCWDRFQFSKEMLWRPLMPSSSYFLGLVTQIFKLLHGRVKFGCTPMGSARRLAGRRGILRNLRPSSGFGCICASVGAWACTSKGKESDNNEGANTHDGFWSFK